MKKLLICIALLMTACIPSQSFALSIRHPEECERDRNSIDCKVAECEISNIARNWPDDTGYREDCEALRGKYFINDEKKMGLAIVVGASTLIVGYLLIRNRTRSKPTKK